MQEDIRIFRYTASRSAYLSIALTLLFLLLVEDGGIGAIISSLVHPIVLKYVMIGIVSSLHLLFSIVILAPLWTKHRLTSTILHLHYGLTFHVTIARSSIISAEPLRERLNMMQFLQAQYDEKKQRITAVFSEQGLVLLHLDKPYPLKLGRRIYPTSSLLINVDQRDELLKLLTANKTNELDICSSSKQL